MIAISLMQKALGEQWASLPPALRAHYQAQDNTDLGRLDIEFPAGMSPFLWLLHGMGALIHRRGQALPATVEKRMNEQGQQHWHRRVLFADGRTVAFRSRWVYPGGNELIEFVNPLLGLRMAVEVIDGQLHYSGRHFVLQLGTLRLPLPEALLGHTTIVETALNEAGFAMDFRLTHPLFGLIYRYHGEFVAQSQEGVPTGF
ncbi:MAG: hypothetical protein B7Y40_05755 [Gammaproteobacteria bacterium 28-57-27]|nr:MAG: hypothetical protein B7Y40_05755 [Gammaproteobacteria bacterium 28-57-27]